MFANDPQIGSFNNSQISAMGINQFSNNNVFSNWFGNNNQTQATLLLFSKKQFIDQYRRPMVYKFDRQVVDRVHEEVHDTTTIGGKRSGKQSVSHACPGAIMPTAVGDHVNASQLSDSWTFVLIVDEASNSVLGSATRHIYSGFFAPGEEPVASSLMGGSWIPNMNAVFHTTHYTSLRSIPTDIGQNGSSVSRGVVNDKDIVNGQLVQLLSPQQKQLMNADPTVLLHKRIDNGVSLYNGQETAVSPQPVESYNGNFGIDSTVNSPVDHLNRIVNAITDTSIHLVSDDETFDPISAAPDIIGNVAERFRTGDIYMAQGMVNPYKEFTLGEVVNRYGITLDVRVVQQPAAYQMDVIDTGPATRQNVAVSIITSLLPGLLIRHGVSDVAFSYTSWTPYDPNGEMLISAADFLYGVTPNEQLLKLQNMKFDICDEFRNLIRSNFGDFSANVRCSITGETVTNIKLMDDNINTINAFNVVENRLGGIMNTAIADLNVVNTNAGQLYGLAAQTLTSPYTPTNGFGNFGI